MTFFKQYIDWLSWKSYFLKNWLNYELWKNKTILLGINLIRISVVLGLGFGFVVSPLGRSKIAEYLYFLLGNSDTKVIKKICLEL
mmetsp:Transcript_17935/g.60987  ORF Transcript_17935/g.60987 Transcript_17935/m.60987 type:complete len:85 (-) Transcript_17935:599-853(-)